MLWFLSCEWIFFVFKWINIRNAFIQLIKTMEEHMNESCDISAHNIGLLNHMLLHLFSTNQQRYTRFNIYFEFNEFFFCAFLFLVLNSMCVHIDADCISIVASLPLSLSFPSRVFSACFCLLFVLRIMHASRKKVISYSIRLWSNKCAKNGFIWVFGTPRAGNLDLVWLWVLLTDLQIVSFFAWTFLSSV